MLVGASERDDSGYAAVIANLLVVLDDARNGTGNQVVIGVDDKEQRALAELDARVDCPGLPTVFLVDVGYVYLSLLFPGGDKGAGLVGRAIVDDEPHEVLRGLGDEALVECGKDVGTVVCWREDADCFHAIAPVGNRMRKAIARASDYSCMRCRRQCAAHQPTGK